MSDKPQRRWTLEIHVQGDEWERVMVEAERLARHVAEHGPACDLVSGGSDVGSWIRVQERPEQTHEKYIAELAAHLAEERPA